MDTSSLPLPPEVTLCAKTQIPALDIPGLRIIRDTTTERVCYTLEIPQGGFRDIFRDLSTASVEGILRNKLQRELERRGLKLPPGSSFDDIEGALISLVKNRWNEEDFESLIEKLHDRYGTRFREIEEELRRDYRAVREEYAGLLEAFQAELDRIKKPYLSRLSREFILALLETAKNKGEQKLEERFGDQAAVFLREIERIRSNPRYQRIVFQDALETIFRKVYERTGASMGIVSTGGIKKADGGLVIKTDASNPLIPKVILGGNGYIVTGSSLEDALDMRSVATTRPVFVHYLVNPDGTVIGEVRTPLTEWAEDVFFPTKSRLEAWIRDPSTLPEGGEIRFSRDTFGKEISLTKTTPKGFFITLGLKESEFMGLIASGEYFTIGYMERTGNLMGNIALTGSRVDLKNPERREDDVVQSGVGIDANWQGRLYRDPKWEVGTRGNFALGVQAGKGGPKNTQTARMTVNTDHFLSYRFTPRLEGRVGVGLDWLWSPNLFPNTFYRIPISERALTNFQRGTHMSLSARYHAPFGEIKGEYVKKSGLIMDSTLARLGYTLRGVAIDYTHEKQTPTHPLISERDRRGVSLIYQKPDGGVSLDIEKIRYGENTSTRGSVMTNMRF